MQYANHNYSVYTSTCQKSGHHIKCGRKLSAAAACCTSMFCCTISLIGEERRKVCANMLMDGDDPNMGCHHNNTNYPPPLFLPPFSGTNERVSYLLHFFSFFLHAYFVHVTQLLPVRNADPHLPTISSLRLVAAVAVADCHMKLVALATGCPRKKQNLTI